VEGVEHLHSAGAHAEYLVGRRAHYLLVVKANQPTLHAQLAGLAWRDIPVADRTRDHAHGRIELRTLKAAAVAGLGFPHAAQAIQATRRAREPASRRWRTETVYAVTSLALGSASPAQLAGYLRGHRRTENQLHWARDVTFADHASRARTGNLPHTMASLRNLATSVLRLGGHANIAAALRHSGRDPTRPLALLSIPIPHPRNGYHDTLQEPWCRCRRSPRRPASDVRRCTSTSQTSKRSWSPGTNVRSPATSNISPKSGTKLATLASGSKLCSRPTPSFPTSTTAPNSRHFCIEVSTSPERSSNSATSSETC